MRVKKIKTNGLLYNFIVIDLPLNRGIIRLFNAVNARPLSCRLGKCQMSGPALEGLRPSQRLALANAALFTATVSTAAALLLVGFVRGCKLGPFCSLSGTRRLHGSDRVADDRGRDQKNIPLELHSLPQFAQPREGLLLATLLGWPPYCGS